jgi:acetoin utilization protein AcuC
VRKTALIYSKEMWAHGHGTSHPLRPERLRMVCELLHAYHALDGERSCHYTPTTATAEELALWHTVEYIDAVRRLSAGDRSVPAYRFNFGPGDNPVFASMYETEALKAGASLLAARLVLKRKVDAAFSYSGGLHHAMADHASGFCVFNDAAIAIRWLASQGQRVVYVDIDAHHGDGVQAAFNSTDQVMTISLHESGHYLFPGTGFVYELGTGRGRGYSINVPLLPYTADEVYLWAFQEIVPPLVSEFAPDVLVTQLGIDTHYQDPLTHLQLTTRGYARMLRSFRDMELPWVALGGGGYNVHTVARAWTLAYGVMSDQGFAEQIPEDYAQAYGDRWLHDCEQPSLSEGNLVRTRQHAEQQVKELKRGLKHRSGGA